MMRTGWLRAAQFVAIALAACAPVAIKQEDAVVIHVAPWMQESETAPVFASPPPPGAITPQDMETAWESDSRALLHDGEAFGRQRKFNEAIACYDEI